MDTISQNVGSCLISDGQYSFFLLFLDVVKWHNSESTTLMRYECPAVNKFWRIGYTMFHGKWLRFMSGPKNKGDIVKYILRMVGSLLQILV